MPSESVAPLGCLPQFQREGGGEQQGVAVAAQALGDLLRRLEFSTVLRSLPRAAASAQYPSMGSPLSLAL